MFQFTHPRGVRRSTLSPRGCSTLFQFTHPRGVRPFNLIIIMYKIFVSIHAPTRGATVILHFARLTIPRFNSRTHAGCDSWEVYEGHKLSVSIHAPTRGATSASGSFPCCKMFQFTHPRGVRLLSVRYIPPCKVSIHAPTRGATQSVATSLGRLLFQFTHPRGVRHVTRLPMPPKQLVSIHAPTRGATIVNGSNSVAPEVSIHAPTRGATRR